jgi:hypothetical protein
MNYIKLLWGLIKNTNPIYIFSFLLWTAVFILGYFRFFK